MRLGCGSGMGFSRIIKSVGLSFGPRFAVKRRFAVRTLLLLLSHIYFQLSVMDLCV